MLTSRRYRVGPEFVVVRIGEHWPLTLQNFPFIIGCKDFCTGNLWGEVSSAAQTSFRQQIEALLSLPQGDETARDHELGAQHVNGFPKFFKQLMYMQRFLQFFREAYRHCPELIGLVRDLGAYTVAHCPRGTNSFEGWATEFYGITVCCAIFGEIN